MGYKGLKVHLHNRKLDYIIVNSTVVAQEKSTHKRGNKISIEYTPIFQYSYKGQTYRARHIISSSKFNRKLETVPGSKYKVGDEVELRVYTNAPDYAVVNTNSSVNFSLYMGVIASLGGLILISEGIYIFLTKVI